MTSVLALSSNTWTLPINPRPSDRPTAPRGGHHGPSVVGRQMKTRRRFRRSRDANHFRTDHVEQQVATWHQDPEGTYRHHMADLSCCQISALWKASKPSGAGELVEQEDYERLALLVFSTR